MCFSVYFIHCLDLYPNAEKIGSCINWIDRKGGYITCMPYNGPTIDYLIICSNREEMRKIEVLFHKVFKEFNTKNSKNHNGGGKEWFEFKKIPSVTELKSILLEYGFDNEIIFGEGLDEYVKCMRRTIRDLQQAEENEDKKIWNTLTIVKPKNNSFEKRQYQENIICIGKKKLYETDRFYLELATGGGKSYIVFKLLDDINSNIIIIFSPRKKINEQNGNDKYLSILSNTYRVFNYSKDTNLKVWLSSHKNEKKIIIACTQSQEKIYNVIADNNLSDISIWFDEAHWSVEGWVEEKKCPSKQFFICNTDRIAKRIFTTASPDKDNIIQHPNIFGELYCPIKVKELIDLKWLCPIKPRILESDTERLNLSNWAIDEFSRTKSNYGFSFHSRDNNAFQLFYGHYQSYTKGTTLIKPYLLINNGGLSDPNKKLLESIDLNYEFRDSKDFEVKDKSIGYVCKQYDMGYDFAKLDYLVFSDPKMSRKDIIQCIGRGTRSDKLGENGRNLNKVLNVMLPVYIGENEGEYKNIIEVMRYLVLELNVDILDDFIIKRPVDNKKKLITHNGLEYKGENNKSVLLDLIYQRNILERPTTKILYRFCRKYGIRTEEAYNRFKQLNPSIPLKNNIYEYSGFKWKNVLDPNGEIYYREEGEIEKAEDQIIAKIDNDTDKEEFYAEREENGWIVLNRYDPKIPPMKIGQLEHYY